MCSISADLKAGMHLLISNRHPLKPNERRGEEYYNFITFRAWNYEGNLLGRTYQIPVVLLPNGITD